MRIHWNKLKSNKRGSVPLTILVGVMVLGTLMVGSILLHNEKFNNTRMTNRVTSRYLGESSIDIQKYLLHNKLENTELRLYFRESLSPTGDLVRTYYKGEPIFRPQEVVDGKMTDINSAVSRLIEEVGRYAAIKDVTTNMKLEDPDTSADTEMNNLCSTGRFFIEHPSDSFDNMKCQLKNMTFTSEIDYMGGTIKVRMRVEGLEVVRESFFAVEASELVLANYPDGDYITGYVKAKLKTENMNIVTSSFQNYTRK